MWLGSPLRSTQALPETELLLNPDWCFWGILALFFGAEGTLSNTVFAHL